MRFLNKAMSRWPSLLAVVATACGCAYFRPPGVLEAQNFEPQLVHTSEIKDDKGLFESLIDGAWESWDYNREVRKLENRGYSEKEARQRAFEREFFNSNP